MKQKFFVAIGTENAAKIKAIKDAFKDLFPEIVIEYFANHVNSGVGVQPIGLDETIKGAINRAKNAYSQRFYDGSTEIKKLEGINRFGIGIEAGMIPIPYTKTGYLDFQYTAIYQSNGNISLGSGPAFEYPQSAVDEILEGKSKEIGEIFENLSGIENIKEKQGAIGFLTNGIYKRADILKYSVLMALIPIKNENFYYKYDKKDKL